MVAHYWLILSRPGLTQVNLHYLARNCLQLTRYPVGFLLILSFRHFKPIKASAYTDWGRGSYFVEFVRAIDDFGTIGMRLSLLISII
jgi:hypothetical protein